MKVSLSQKEKIERIQALSREIDRHVLADRIRAAIMEIDRRARNEERGRMGKPVNN